MYCYAKAGSADLEARSIPGEMIIGEASTAHME
jgi:hypothetical protein